MRPRGAWCWAAMLLLTFLCDGAGGRRGRTGGRSGGFGAVSRGGGGSSRGSKVAGAIAAGAAAGYGMGLLGRPRPSRLGHGAPAARPPGGFHAPSWPDAYAKRGPPSRAAERRRGGTALLLLPAACVVGRGLLC